MTSRCRHLIAALGFAALAVLCFVLLTWALVEGAVEGKFPSDIRSRSSIVGHQYRRINTVYRREEAPARYWLIVGLLGSFGTLFAVMAALERGSYRNSRISRKGEDQSSGLLAKIDRACGLYPEGQEALLRTKAVLVDLNSPAVETVLDGLLEKILRASDREAALKEIQSLAKALNLVGKF